MKMLLTRDDLDMAIRKYAADVLSYPQSAWPKKVVLRLRADKYIAEVTPIEPQQAKK